MGAHEIREKSEDREIRAFTREMLADLKALEQMLELGMFETDVRRIGVEQEMALVDGSGHPAAVATGVLDRLGDSRFTTELALFNLEANLPPQLFAGRFLKHMEEELEEVLGAVADAAAPEGADVLLTGILPSLGQQDLNLSNMTPKPRYRQLNDTLLALSGGGFPIFIRGVDDLEMRPDNVMFEAANTSFQLHLQVAPDAFARLYNLAQLITAPLLAAAANSPLLFGKRLWHETRVALFERSVDTRSDAARARGRLPRVSLGSDWVRESALELFQDAVARFPVALTRELEASSLEQVAQGVAPKLAALMLHNGTVWRWNRACYGVADGVAHLRIENRVLPAGPTVLDEVANASLFYGLMAGLDEVSGEIPARLPFDDARGNFVKVARQSLGAQLTWLDGRRIAVKKLLLEELLPIARDGLGSLDVPSEDIERYLGTVEARIRSDKTGARWIIDALSRCGREAAPEDRVARLTRVMLRHQKDGEPVHLWPQPAGVEDDAPPLPRTVADIMSTDLFTVRPRDVVDLATCLMSWKHFRHVPVETADGELVGLVSHRALLRLDQHRTTTASAEPVAVATIMDRNPECVAPETPLAEGLQHLLTTGKGYLAVVSEKRLVGMATERDFLRAMAVLLGSSQR